MVTQECLTCMGMYSFYVSKSQHNLVSTRLKSRGHVAKRKKKAETHGRDKKAESLWQLTCMKAACDMRCCLHVSQNRPLSKKAKLCPHRMPWIGLCDLFRFAHYNLNPKVLWICWYRENVRSYACCWYFVVAKSRYSIHIEYNNYNLHEGMI